MRITPNHPRLRLVALVCWVIAAWWIIHGGMLVINHPTVLILAVSTRLLALLLLAIGIAFWLLSTDQRAGIVFDTKGILLNLGHSSSFIAWENIERVGVTNHRAHLLAIGSGKQLGIALRDTHSYIQSYEQRLPASRGLLARVMRLLQWGLRPFQRDNDASLAAQITACRARTGYDVLVPEALLGGQAAAFVELLDTYRLRPMEKRWLQNIGAGI